MTHNTRPLHTMPPRQCPRQARGAWCGPRKRRTGKPIENSVRQDILLYFAQGFSVTKTLELMRKDSVKRHGVLLFYRGPSLRTIERCRTQFKRFRRATPVQQQERIPTFTYVQGAAIMEWVNCQSDGYSLQDVISWFHFTFPQRVLAGCTMGRWLKYMGFTRKKRTNTAAQVFSLRLTYLLPLAWILCLKIAELRNLLAAVLPAPSTQQNT